MLSQGPRDSVGQSRLIQILLPLLLAFTSSDLFGQFGDIFGFGKNKVHYKTFDWSVIKTEHFDIYFYEEERQAAMDAGEIAERSYSYLSKVLNYRFKEKIPLLLYASHKDFQQTNAIRSAIGEGTQGVTESLKGRMILPFTGSYAQFVHVLTHEMVHAFQFDIMFSVGSVGPIGGLQPPLWFIEGMAEYLSVGMDNITRMWMRDAVLNNTLLSIPEMTFIFDIRVYRMGQAIWYYVGERYGKEVVGRIYKTAIGTGDLNHAFRAHTGLDLYELSMRWGEDALTRYLPDKVVLPKPGEVAKPITDRCKDGSGINIVPAISPDGTNLAYIGDRNYTLNMILRSLEEKDKERKIVQSGRSQNFEVLRYFDTSMNWSPDGTTFSFVAKAGANDAIYMVNAEKQKVTQRLTFKTLAGMAAPSWAPEGDRLVFSGLHGGISNLYLVNREGSNLVQITNDRYAYLHPQWSPGGTKIAFTTDRGPNTHLEQLIFGEYNIALYDIETKEIELLTKTGGNHINPIWSKNGDEILFISDMSGIPNIYSIDLETRELYWITNFITGVSGIITESPAISLAPETGRLAFSAFSNGGWDIYILDQYNREKVDFTDVAVLDTLEDPNDKYLAHSLADSSEFILSGYKTKLREDFIVAGGAFASNVGFSGMTAILFSDMLGDKNLLIQAALYGNPFESTIIATYLNQRRRLNWAFDAFQFRQDFGGYTASNAAQFQSQIFRGLGMSASRPFNTFTRLEFGATFVFINEDVVRLNVETGETLDRGPRNSIYTSLDLSLVRDTAFWGLAAPISGTRARFTVRQNIGDLDYTSLAVDYRKYVAINVPRYSIAYRLSGGLTHGRRDRFFIIGGPSSFRGADYYDLSGTRNLFQNIEFRFPVFPHLPIQYDFLTAVIFYDVAQVWGHDRFSRYLSFRFKDIRTSYGFGLRMNMGGMLLLRWDFPLKKEPGTPSSFFTIGMEY